MTPDPRISLSRDALAATSVLVVGDVMLDRYWFGEVDRISPEAPVPVVQVKREEFRLGGAANVARNIAALGAKVTLLSVLGTDEAGKRMLELLENSGIVSALKSDSGLSTTVKLRVSGRQQQLLRIDFERRPTDETLAAMTSDFTALVGQHDVVLMSDYGKGGLGHIAAMIAVAREAGIPVLVDPKGSDYDVYAGATLITPNRSELAQVAGSWEGEADLADRAARLRQQINLEALLVTRSEEGMSLFDDDGELHVSADAREVFDVTGAGDTVIAVMAVLAGAGMTLRDAVPLANRAGGIVVSQFGTATVSYNDLFAATNVISPLPQD